MKKTFLGNFNSSFLQESDKFRFVGCFTREKCTQSDKRFANDKLMSYNVRPICDLYILFYITFVITPLLVFAGKPLLS